MRKIEDIQNNKVISNYGGVGSLIETKSNGSLMIKPYNRWPYFTQREGADKPTITDENLLRKVKSVLPSITTIYRIPTGEMSEQNHSSPTWGELNQCLSAEYFPKWFFCHKCRRMHRLNEWETLWQTTFPNDNGFKRNYPACNTCSHSVRNGRGISRQSLEQLRFVMVSYESSEIMDIPFERLFSIVAQNHGLPNDAVRLDNIPQYQQELQYASSSFGDGLQSVYIKSGNNVLSLAQLNRLYLVYGNNAYRLAIKSGNDIYYPNIIKSLYIPPIEIPNDIKNAIRNMTRYGQTLQVICGIFPAYPPKGIAAVVNGVETVDNELLEYRFLTNFQMYRNNTVKDVNHPDWFKALHYPHLHLGRFESFVAVKRLKESRVLTSYNRVSPSNLKKWWSIPNQCEELMEDRMSKLTSDNPDIDYIPGVEMYGEGLFFQINVSDLPEEKRYEFLHSISHIIMKELEFQCGYPVSSLCEKIMPAENEGGVLIYTVTGSEGSFGGLVSLLPSDTNSNQAKLTSLIERAFQRAKHCTNDPICQKDKGHCYACLDIPEISCECFNDQLDRNLLNEYGLNVRNG